jgi:hypothetical protein
MKLRAWILVNTETDKPCKTPYKPRRLEIFWVRPCKEGIWKPVAVIVTVERIERKAGGAASRGGPRIAHDVAEDLATGGGDQ